MERETPRTSRPLSRATTSLNLYAALIGFMGVSLLVAPAQAGVSGADGIVRSLGALLVVLAAYYRVAAVYAFRPFIVATIAGRFAMAAFQIGAIGAGWLEAPSWGGAGLDLAGAAWTFWALRADERAPR